MTILAGAELRSRGRLYHTESKTNKESRGAVDPFFSASSSRKTLADLRHSLLTGFHRKKLRAIF